MLIESIELYQAENINYQLLYNSTGTIIRFGFPSSQISLGSIINFNVNGELKSIVSSSEITISPNIRSDSDISLLSIIVSVPKHYEILGLAPSSHQSNIGSRYTRFMWNYVDINSFAFSLTYSINEDPTALLFSHSNFSQSVKMGDQIEVSVNITNANDYPIVLEIKYPTWFTTNISDKVIVKGNGSIHINLYSTSDLEVGNYSGYITVLYKSQLLYQIYVSFQVKSNAAPFIMLIISIIGFLGLIAHHLNGRYHFVLRKTGNIAVSDPIEIKSTRKGVEILSSNITKSNKMGTPKININYIELELLLGARELNIVKYLDENMGSTQQNIADAFDLSKATISRILGKLEKREFIRKEQVGMSKKVYLNFDNLPSE